MKKNRIESLYNLQDEILSALSKFARDNDFPFILTGGTALVRFLLKSSYRISYDLDFFSIRDFSPQELEQVVDFLSRKFVVTFKGKLGTEEIPIYKYEVSSSTCSVKVDFVYDVFSGVFNPIILPGTFLKIDVVEAVYFRKVYSVLSSSIQGIAVDRIKDVLDLIKLDQEVQPFADYVINEFCKVWKQNVAREVTPAHVLKSLKKLFFDVEERKVEVEEVLHGIYLTNITVGEILRWLRSQIEKLSQL